MVSFKFSFGVVGKSKEKGIANKYAIIVAKCEGIIRYIDGKKWIYIIMKWGDI